MDNEFATIEAYWRDPTPFDTAKRIGQTVINALFAEHEAAIRRQMQAHWDKEDN